MLNDFNFGPNSPNTSYEEQIVFQTSRKEDVPCTHHEVMLEQDGLKSKHGEGMMLVLKDSKDKVNYLKGNIY